MSTILPNIGLVVPVPGDSDYPTSVQTSFTNLDNHDHSVGSGLPVERVDVDATDNTSVTATSGVLSVKNGGVGGSHIQANSVTQAKRGPLPIGSTSDTSGATAGTQQDGTVSWADLSVGFSASQALTLTGRPVLLFVNLILDVRGLNSNGWFVRVVKNGVQIRQYYGFPASSTQDVRICDSFLDNSGLTGAVTYKIQFMVGSTTPNNITVYTVDQALPTVYMAASFAGNGTDPIRALEAVEL